MSQFATKFKHRQHTENITDDDECPIHLFNYLWLEYVEQLYKTIETPKNVMLEILFLRFN